MFLVASRYISRVFCLMYGINAMIGSKYKCIEKVRKRLRLLYHGRYNELNKKYRLFILFILKREPWFSLDRTPDCHYGESSRVTREVSSQKFMK